MKTTKIVAGALACLTALTFAGCADSPGTGDTSTTASAAATTATTTEAAAFKACIVSDTGGFDDKSFNQTSYAGVLKAQTDFGIAVDKVQSKADSDYASNIQAMVDAKCSIIIGVGYLLADAITAGAKANPDVKFALVDSTTTEPLSNARGLTFQTNEAAFLAGYLAAGMTKSGTVATYGGLLIDSVTIFMDGYVQGVDYYNAQKGTDVKVIGWDRATKTGDSVESFTDAVTGKTLAETQLSKGADILFPVAGGSGNGALQVAKEQPDKVVGAIWVDTDGCESAAEYCSVLMTSVEKAVDVAVYDAIKAAYEGKWTSDNYLGTIANDGVRISDFHEFADKVPAELQTEIADLQAQIKAGTLKVKATGEA